MPGALVVASHSTAALLSQSTHPYTPTPSPVLRNWTHRHHSLYCASTRRVNSWASFSSSSTQNLQQCSGRPQGGSYTLRSALSTESASPMAPPAVDFKKLQNGSDIRGVAVEGVEGESVNLTEPVAEAIASAFVKFLREKAEGAGGDGSSSDIRVSVGHDSRISANSMKAAVARGLAGEGASVVVVDLASTPAMFNTTITQSSALHCPADGAIMITASHLPFNRNGLKFFTAKGGASKADISRILALAADVYNSSSADTRAANQKAADERTVHVDYMSRYAEDLVSSVRKAAGGIERPLEGFHIVVDAGNGAGGFFAGRVLEPLGGQTSGSQFLNPDGMFPNHIPNPEDKDAMAAITKAVLENKADLGMIFDTDVDRAAAVDASGKEINRNKLIALLAAIVLEEHPASTVVTDSVTSDGLTHFIESKLGGKHHRFKRGYKNVIDEGIRLNAVGEECHLAIETSGHGALKENRWLDDGAFLMVKLLIKLATESARTGKKDSGVLTRMIEDLVEADVVVEVRFKIDETNPDVVDSGFKAYGANVLQALDEFILSEPRLTKATVNHEGVRVSGFGGWFLLRMSLHDPVLPLNIEAPTAEAARKLGSSVLSVVEKFGALDLSSLKKFIASQDT